MTAEAKKFAEFFAELAEGLQHLATEKERWAELVNYDMGAVIASIAGGRVLRERDIDAGFRNLKLSYPRKEIKLLLFSQGNELNAQQLCDYFNIGRIYAQRKYSTMRLGQPQLKRFFQLLHDQCKLQQTILRKKNELCEMGFAKEAFKEIDFFQNGYIDSYSIYEFVKYYTQKELDPMASAGIVDKFAANEQRVDLQAFLAFFEPVTGVFTPVASSVASIDIPEPPSTKPVTGKIQKNSPQRSLARYKSQNKFNMLRRDSDSVLDPSDSFERIKERERKTDKVGRIPDRYRMRHQEENNDSDCLDRQGEGSNRQLKYKSKAQERRRLRSPENIFHQDKELMGSSFEWEPRSKVQVKQPKKDVVADKRSPFSRKADPVETKHETRISNPRNLQYLQQIKVFKEDKSLETLVSEIDNVRKSHDTHELEEDHGRYQNYLKAKSKSRVRTQLKAEMAKLTQLLSQRQQIVQQLVSGYQHFNCFHGFNVLDSRQMGFLDFKEFFGSLQQMGIDVSDHSKKLFWKSTSKHSRFAFQNYLSLFDLRWNRSFYNEVKDREPLSLEFSGLESWSTELQMAYLKFIASIIDNTVAIREQKTALNQLLETIPERNLPKFMCDKNQQQLTGEQCLALFGQSFSKVLIDIVGDSKCSLTAEMVWRYLESHR